MNLFNWGVKELKSETTTYGIMCKHIITYYDIKKDIREYYWNNIYTDYNIAINSNKEFIKEVEEAINKASYGVITIKDMCFYKNTFNFINAYTTDPKLVVFKNNVMKFSYDIVVLNGGNLVIKKTDGDDILEGDFKYVGNGE